MFLPISKLDMQNRGMQYCDFIVVTGDAYVDHPSFGAAVISRVVEHEGFAVGIIAQPRNDADYTKLGRPRYGFLVNAGNIDSMVAHYTAARRKRSEDLYSPGGKAGFRPDRAVTVYSKALKRIYPEAPVVIGGIEASLRRFAHYDYWSDTVMPSVLADSGADMLSYGMGELSIREITKGLAAGKTIAELSDIRGTCVLTDEIADGDCVVIDSYEKVKEDKPAYALSVKLQYREQDAYRGKTVYQPHGDRFLRQNPPQYPLTTAQMDEVYELPYMYYYHPIYEAAGGIPAIEEVEFSITHSRGCFGSCNFCALAFHQGRAISSRSHESVIAEAERMVKSPRFKGYIHDVGGPTANFRVSACKKANTVGACADKRCLSPKPCEALKADHSDYLALLRRLRAIKGVKKVFIRSGIRFDYLMYDESNEFFRELVQHHISGQLKVAPEHISDDVLKLMGKPPVAVFDEFKKQYEKLNREYKKEQYLVPYLMSSHPGSKLADAIKLALYLKENHLRPEQVQDFYPTPGTVSSCMFHTGINPITMQKVYVPRTDEEKAMQRALLQWAKPQNYAAVRAALRKAGREDLIGFGDKCLVPPEQRKQQAYRPANPKGGNNAKQNPARRGQTEQGKKPLKTRPKRHGNP